MQVWQEINYQLYIVTSLLYFSTNNAGERPARLGQAPATNIDAVNTWVKMIHIHSLLRSTMRKQLQLRTSSKHREMTEGMKKWHVDLVRKLKSQ